MTEQAGPSTYRPPSEADVVRLYLDLDAAKNAGDAAAVSSLTHRIGSLLSEMVQRSYDQAIASWAERRDRDAFAAFDAALAAHRLNLLGIALPISPSACYLGLSSIYRAWQQPASVAASIALAVNQGAHFYRRPNLCQIPILEGLYEQLFGRKDDGIFVEVGAFDGETYGNTAGLADQGWRGLYIEPVRAAFELCRQRHASNPRVSVRNCAIGASDGTTEIFQAREFSTVSQAHLMHGIASGWMSAGAYQAIEVEQYRLDTVLSEASIEAGFDLLVVDVEGAEELVFRDFDLARWRPAVMIVELGDFEAPGQSPVEPAAPFDRAACKRVRELIRCAGYEQIYADFTNSIFRKLLP